MTPFKFPDDILSACSVHKDDPALFNQVWWRTDLSKKKKQEIAKILKDYAKDCVFLVHRTSTVGMFHSTAYCKIKSVSWGYSGNLNQLGITYDAFNVHMGKDGLALSIEEDENPIFPDSDLGDPIPRTKFNRILRDLMNNLSRKTIGKSVTLK